MKSAMSSSSSDLAADMPALRYAASRRPCSASTWATTASLAARSVTSRTTNGQPRSAATLRLRSLSRSARTTGTSRSRSLAARARPKPPVPPVMSATEPAMGVVEVTPASHHEPLVRGGAGVGMDLELVLDPTGRRAAVACMVAAFLLTFLTTRLITRAIRTGRGPFRNASVGGIHVHHEVYGIFLLLITGTAEFAYGPEGSWLYVLAILFGVGAALTLDEFALWLHLEDVYWSQEGRSSIDAVLIALVVGCLLLVGANPFDTDQAGGEIAVAATVVVNTGFALVSILKGRVVLGVTGVFVPFLAVFSALRLARPSSPWARRRYPAGSERRRRSEERFPAGRRHRWDGLVDLFADVP